VTSRGGVRRSSNLKDCRRRRPRRRCGGPRSGSTRSAARARRLGGRRPPPVSTLRSGASGVVAVTVSPDRTCLAAACSDQKVCVWTDARRGTGYEGLPAGAELGAQAFRIGRQREQVSFGSKDLLRPDESEQTVARVLTALVVLHAYMVLTGLL